MRHPFKEFLYFSRGERRGILLLATGIVLVFLVGMILDRRNEREAAEIGQQTAAEKAEADSLFLHSLQQQTDGRGYSHYTDNRQQVAVEYFPFDPNAADSADFRRLGLPGWMARNIVKYRAAGGKFRRPEDFKKIYGMSEEQYNRLAPYITIPSEMQRPPVPRIYQPREKANRTDSTEQDTVARNTFTAYKYPAGTLVDLNRADTTELKKIPGVGGVISRMIVTYRERLGGFYSLEQLEEIRLDYRPLQEWLHIDTAAIRRIPVNRAGIERLRNHPYINFYQARALVEYRKKRGDIRNLKPFVLYEEFSEGELKRLGYYLDFEE